MRRDAVWSMNGESVPIGEGGELAVADVGWSHARPFSNHETAFRRIRFADVTQDGHHSH
jgi:hypothetical protein